MPTDKGSHGPDSHCAVQASIVLGSNMAYEGLSQAEGSVFGLHCLLVFPATELSDMLLGRKCCTLIVLYDCVCRIAYLALPKNNSEDLTPLAVDSVINLVNEYDDSLLGISFDRKCIWNSQSHLN